ncbi:Chaperone protein DnaJ [Rhynchospora pubera]|uniref:Chaperone protein DnaJ n=1 Tax=Rhynchospora pubera TaxID=906938 RepID=A0AAV8F6N8_9POAL|nr:Chaperone protein DnaJ [Rhynchospora pubera]
MISPPQFFGRHIPSPPPSPTTSSVSLRPFTTITASATATATATATTSLSACSSLYDILGIPITATFPEIKSAYRRLARTCHPDTLPDSSSDQFLRLQTAYATLSDPDQRAAYDRRLQLHRRQCSPPRQQMNGAMQMRYSSLSRSPTFPSFYGRRKRTWETDQCW